MCRTSTHIWHLNFNWRSDDGDQEHENEKIYINTHVDKKNKQESKAMVAIWDSGLQKYNIQEAKKTNMLQLGEFWMWKATKFWKK